MFGIFKLGNLAHGFRTSLINTIATQNTMAKQYMLLEISTVINDLIIITITTSIIISIITKDYFVQILSVS